MLLQEIPTVERRPCTMHLPAGMNVSGTGRRYGRKKRSPIKKGYYDGTEELVAVDLPGAYSMSPLHRKKALPADTSRMRIRM